MIGADLRDHPHRPLPQLRRIPPRRVRRHDLILPKQSYLRTHRGDSNVPPDSGVQDEKTQQARKDYDAWTKQHDSLKTELAGYDAVAENSTAPNSYLLGIDNHGRAAIAVNNPDTAQNVATYVPGTSQNTMTIHEGMNRAQTLVDQAGKAGSPRTSAIAWYGYNAPQSIVPEAAVDGYAEHGAGPLDSFQNGIAAAHDGPRAHTTVIGHSYGTTVIGEAAKGGHSLNADDVVFAGSPGVHVEHATDLHLTGVDPSANHSHVFATAAGGDPVPMIGTGLGDLAHGPNPASDDFGATQFYSNPGHGIHIPGTNADIRFDPDIHSHYFDKGSRSLDAMGKIIANGKL